MNEIDPIQKAKNRLLELDGIIASAQAEKEEFSQFLATYKKLQTSSINGNPNHTIKKTKGDIAIECALELCQKTDDYVKTKDIYALMEEKGYQIDSQTPVPIVSSYLGNSDRLEVLRGKGWRLKH